MVPQRGLDDLLRKIGVVSTVDAALRTIVAAGVKSQRVYSTSWQHLPDLRRAYLMSFFPRRDLELTVHDALRDKGRHTFIALDVLFAMQFEPQHMNALLRDQLEASYVFPLSRCMLSIQETQSLNVELLTCYNDNESLQHDVLLTLVAAVARAEGARAPRAPRTVIRLTDAVVEAPDFCDDDGRTSRVVIRAKRRTRRTPVAGAGVGTAPASPRVGNAQRQLCQLFANAGVRCDATTGNAELKRAMTTVIAAADKTPIRTIARIVMLDLFETLYTGHYKGTKHFHRRLSTSKFKDLDHGDANNLLMAYVVLLTLLWQPEQVLVGTARTTKKRSAIAPEKSSIVLDDFIDKCPWNSVHPETLLLLLRFVEAYNEGGFDAMLDTMSKWKLPAERLTAAPCAHAHTGIVIDFEIPTWW